MAWLRPAAPTLQAALPSKRTCRLGLSGLQISLGLSHKGNGGAHAGHATLGHHNGACDTSTQGGREEERR